MKHYYEIVAKDSMIETPIVYAPESVTPLTKEEIVKTYRLNDSDIDWYKIYEVVDGVKTLMV